MAVTGFDGWVSSWLMHPYRATLMRRTVLWMEFRDCFFSSFAYGGK
jgi:hypothetical protein